MASAGYKFYYTVNKFGQYQIAKVFRAPLLDYMTSLLEYCSMVALVYKSTACVLPLV